MHLLRRLLVAAGPSYRLSGSRAFAAAAATNKAPRSWVMLNELVRRCGDRDDFNAVADARTTAEARSSTGRNLQVSLSRAAPPASSFLYTHWADGAGGAPRDEKEQEGSHDVVVAAHGDSVLLEVTVRQQEHRRDRRHDYFLYVAGADDRAKPPSLSLLPARDYARNVYCRHEGLEHRYTSLLRRGEDELLVVHLESALISDGDGKNEADLSVHRVGSGRGWEPWTGLPIVDGPDTDDDFSEWDGEWWPYTTVPVGDRFVCWVEYNHGVLVCDMADEAGPKIRRAPMPDMDHLEDTCGGHLKEGMGPKDWMHTWNVGAAGAGALRYVSVDLRCCCGHSPIVRTSCLRSVGLFAVNTWTLDLETMEWVKGDTLDCEELWALPGYADAGLPREETEFPVVSSDNADVVCFLVRRLDTEKKWTDLSTVEVDTRKKALLSVCPFVVQGDAYLTHYPAKL